jgi:hypothetical protein
MRAKDYGINLEDLKIPPGNLKRPVAKKPKRKLQFYKFPVRVMESVLEKYGSAQAGPFFAIRWCSTKRGTWISSIVIRFASVQRTWLDMAFQKIKSVAP